MIIDTHAHFTPQIMLDASASNIDRFPNIQLKEENGNCRLAFIGQNPTRPLPQKLRNSDMRLEWMDTLSIDNQVVEGWLDSLAYEVPP